LKTAILLAAGRGRKFWPYGVVRNKCAFPIANVPLVRRLADSLQELGFERLIVVNGHGAGSVRAALAPCAAGPATSPPVTFVSQPEPSGTAEAVLHAAEAMADEPFLALSADVSTDPENLHALRDRFIESGAVAAALVQRLGDERPRDWITCDLRDRQLSGFQGHGRGGSHRLTGFYAFQPAAIEWLRANPGLMTHVPVGGMPAPEAEIAESLARMAAAGEAVLGVEATGFLVDVDKPWHALEATREVLRHQAVSAGESRIPDGCRVAESAEIHGRLFLEAGAEIGERVVVQGDAWIGPGARVANGAILGQNCVVGAGARLRDYPLVGSGSVIGPDCIIGHGAEFSGILLEGSYLYHYCEISGICGARVDIGAASVCGTLRFDDLETPHRIGGRPEQPRLGANSSYLGDYSRTGVNAILMPGVKTGVYSCVGPGVILYDDLPDRQLVLARQQLVFKEWGPERYGW
jgi:bifunctional UDP-N-acetylglucosamine pyrophosphorylase/glucosamine-1-phosphate N-acetyltransferase